MEEQVEGEQVVSPLMQPKNNLKVFDFNKFLNVQTLSFGRPYSINLSVVTTSTAAKLALAVNKSSENCKTGLSLIIFHKIG